MPERDALNCILGDGFLIIAAGVRREKDGALAADLMLQNGHILFADRAVLNTADGPAVWAAKATAEDRPAAERMAEAIREYMLPDALKMLQEESNKPTQADDLVGLVLEVVGDLAAEVAAEIELFHTPDQESYATLTIDTHRQTHRLRSRTFRLWMARKFFEKRQKTPNTQALVDATSVLEGKALFEGPEQCVYTRIAEQDGVVYLDLANEHWQVVAVDPSGWRVVDDPPVKFRRPKGMLPLPTPTHGGSVDLLRALVNVPSDDDGTTWRLVVAWLIGAFRPSGPYAILVIHGEHGSAKSTLARFLRRLIDPNEAEIRSQPREEHDLVIAAGNGWTLCFDNVSHLSDWLSDAYCRIATGAGFGTRMLYANDEEMLFTAQRPIVLNGIDEIATRPDLIDRSIIIYLPSIPDDQRREEADVVAAFEAARPAILGALLTAVSGALSREATTKLGRKPRMADFARWVTAASEALGWEPDAFLDAYFANRRDANDLTLDASPVSQIVREWAATQIGAWEGTATDLLKVLDGTADDKILKLKTWPDSGRTLSNALRRLAPNLRSAGIQIAFDIRRHGGKRCIRIERSENPSSPSSPGGHSPQRGAANGGDGGGDDGFTQQGLSSPSSPPSSPENPRTHAQGDDGDDGDDEMPPRSADRQCSLCGKPLPPDALALCDICEERVGEDDA